MQRSASSVGGYMDGFMNPQSVLYILVFLLVVACAGGIIGLLTRNMIILIGVAGLVLAFLTFHQYLPLPDMVHLEINSFRSRIGM